MVFQTDSGAIGTADRGGCNTTNGGCVVQLRSQNPRYSLTTLTRRAGVATITVSTSNNTNVPLTGQIQIALSGKFASRINHIMDDGSVIPVGPAGIALVNAGCAAQPVRVQINDARNNAMPSKTSLISSTAYKLQIEDIFPSIVPSIAPSGSLSAADGSIHVIPVSPSSECLPSGKGVAQGSILVKILTPAGNVTTLPISMTFPTL